MHRLIVAMASIVFMASVVAGQQRTILGVFAHPDDENMVGSVLAKYARSGNRVYVIIATDGKYGARVTNIPEGDELGRVRRKETECACEKLGIEKPIFLGLERLDTKIGVRPYLTAHKSLVDVLKQKIEGMKPDVLITFGPDGEYGHSEHIVVGAAVQELLLREGWAGKYPLYFPLETKTSSADDPDLGYVSESYINASVTFSDADVERQNEASKCYISQFKPEELQASIDAARKDKTNARHFRRFAVERRRSMRGLMR